MRISFSTLSSVCSGATLSRPLPDEQSGISNNSSMLYSSVTEIMANQLNNIFQKLDIPLDLGMKYQPNERGNDIFDN